MTKDFWRWSTTEAALQVSLHKATVSQQIQQLEVKLGTRLDDVPVAMGRLVFAPEIRGFLERYSKITIELGCTDQAVRLVKEGGQLASRWAVAGVAAFSPSVGDLRFVLCVAPHYIEQHGLPETAEDVARHRESGFVLASTGKVRPVTLMREGRKVEFDVPARFVTTDSAAALSAGWTGWASSCWRSS